MDAYRNCGIYHCSFYPYPDRHAHCSRPGSLCAGPNNPADTQPYMEIMAHELLQLYWYGADVRLPESLSDGPDATVNVKVMLLQWVCDYRGYPKCFRHRQSPHHRHACYECDAAGMYASGKTAVYPYAWRACSATEHGRRINGAKLNNPDGIPASTGPQKKKTDAWIRDAAKLADQALKAGQHWDSAGHPCGETGTTATYL